MWIAYILSLLSTGQTAEQAADSLVWDINSKSVVILLLMFALIIAVSYYMPVLIYL